MSKKIIVSACLAGIECRYDCASEARQDIVKMVESGDAIPVCPEQLGGLPTPRPPAEIQSDGKVADNLGQDVTDKFNKGAQEALKITKMLDAKEAYLKTKSPMCGTNSVYDGSFSGKLKNGDGVFTKLLKKLGIKITPVD